MILDAKGKPCGTLTDFARAHHEEKMLDLNNVIEMLHRKNDLLQTAPWKHLSRLLDQFGRPVWKDT